MANYKKTSMVSGAWAKASELGGVSKARIVSETKPQPSNFVDKNGNPKDQDVCKIRFEGLPEALNVSLNKSTINGLVDAFGEDSANWQGHSLRVETEKMRVAGKAVTALYLIPEGYIRTDDENGYAVIVRDGGTIMQKQEEQGMPQSDVDDVNSDLERVKLKDVPF